MEPTIIKTERNYKKTLTEVDRLIALDPEPGTPEANRLDLLSMLVENYEKEHFLFNLPSPIDAIQFRMEEQGLKQKDLIPYMGSKSKVSEVLSGKRPLTIQMVRALVNGLDIPAEVLLQDVKKPEVNKLPEIDWSKFPIKEMVKRGWIFTKVRNVIDNAEQLMQEFLAPLGGAVPSTAVCRRTMHKRSEQDINTYSLIAWTAQVLIRAKKECCEGAYKAGVVSRDFLKEVARLSLFEQGPLLAKEFLERNGIALIIEPHLESTKLDGGSMLSDDGRPIIGLTIRHDRLDNFWFTLLHELSHVARHLKTTNDVFIDNNIDKESKIQMEKEADKLARESFIPRNIWMQSDAYLQRTEETIKELAKDLRIHYAIVAGRLRYETNNYYDFDNLIGRKQAKKLFFPNKGG